MPKLIFERTDFAVYLDADVVAGLTSATARLRHIFGEETAPVDLAQASYDAVAPLVEQGICLTAEQVWIVWYELAKQARAQARARGGWSD